MKSPGLIKTINKKYDFIAFSDSNEINSTPASLLFSSKEYLNVVSSECFYSFFIYNKIKKCNDGLIRFQIHNEIASSLVNAPFGSIELVKPIEFDVLYNFIDFVGEFLADSGIARIQISHYPWIYDPVHHNKIISAYGFTGFIVDKIDINHFIKIDSEPLFRKLHQMEKRRLEKCISNKFLFKEHKNKDIDILFKFIKSSREQRKIPLNINLNLLKALSTKLADHYKLFSLSSNEEFIACTIAVRTKDNVLYNFLPAHNPKYDTYSPMVYLIERIYEYAKQNKYQFLDLGISSIENHPQSDLIKFKERMGGITASKLLFSRNL